jgi:hypothetical protein
MRNNLRALGITLAIFGLWVAAILIPRRAIVHFYGDPWKPGLTPPATAEELADYRIVTNQFNLMAVQKRDGTNWALLPNRWKDTNDCRWDIDWWIASSRTNNQEERAIWLPLHRQ